MRPTSIGRALVAALRQVAEAGKIAAGVVLAFLVGCAARQQPTIPNSATADAEPLHDENTVEVATGGLAHEKSTVDARRGGLPLSIALDSGGNAWVLGEFQTHINYIPNDSALPAAATQIEIPHHPSAYPFLHSGRRSKVSVWGESVLWDPVDELVWLSQGGAAASCNVGNSPHSPPCTVRNHSRVLSYQPGTMTWKAYNFPGNRNEVRGLTWDAERNWVWAAESGFYSDFTPFFDKGETNRSTSHQSTIMAFDPDTAANDINYLWPTTDALDSELCTGEETPTKDSCFKRYALPETALNTAHLAVDPDGFVWFTNFWGTSIGRLNPATEAVIIYPMPAPSGTCGLACDAVGSGPWEIRISPDSQYVVFNEYFDNTLTRFDRSRATEVACQSLDGNGENPCTEDLVLPVTPTIPSLDYVSIHSIEYHPNGSLWFTITTPVKSVQPLGRAASTLGFIPPDWSRIIVLDPSAFSPRFNPNWDISTAGIAINPSTGEIWVAEFEPQAVARFTPVD